MKLSIEKYMQIMLISETFKGDEGKIEREILKAIGIDLDAPKKENDEIIRKINNLITEKPALANRFIFDGKEWGFIPNLQKITTNEFIDLEGYIKDGKQLHRIAAILYRPIKSQNLLKRTINSLFFEGDLYEIEKYEGTQKYADVLKNIDFRIVMGAMFFFSSLGEDLSNAIDTYTQKKMAKKKAIVSK